MSTFDVSVESAEITQIKWSEDCDFNLVRTRGDEVRIKQQGLEDMCNDEVSLLASATEAEQLIKAIQKAIDLGWFR